MLGFNVNQPAGFTTDTRVRLGAVVCRLRRSGGKEMLLNYGCSCTLTCVLTAERNTFWSGGTV